MHVIGTILLFLLLLYVLGASSTNVLMRGLARLLTVLLIGLAVASLLVFLLISLS